MTRLPARPSPADRGPGKSRLFFAVIASGIAFGVACSESTSETAAGPAGEAPAQRLPAKPAVRDAGVDAEAEEHGGGPCDAGPDAADGGWCPTK